jgi:hypothetical protein
MNTILRTVITFIGGLLLAACDARTKMQSKGDIPEDKPAGSEDIPILPVTLGDAWTYSVDLEIPAGATSAGAAAVSTRYKRTRTYLGKVSAAQGLPACDCFEIEIEGSPNEREFVEIRDDRVLMRGSLMMRPESTRPMWLETPVPFVVAGMKPGTAMPTLNAGAGSLTRKTQVIARESINVPAGRFHCIQILTTGNDGDLELRRSIWFAPGTGIIREQKSRYRNDKLVFRETQELSELKHAR